jgi:hypothetical protein
MSQEKASPKSLVKRWEILVERHSLLKEYLLHPINKAREENGAMSLVSAEAIKRHQVLPSGLWSQMTSAYHKTDSEIKELERALRSHPQISWNSAGTPYVKEEE